MIEMFAAVAIFIFIIACLVALTGLLSIIIALGKFTIVIAVLSILIVITFKLID